MGLRQLLKKIINKYFFNPRWKCLVCGKEVFEGQRFCDDCNNILPYNDGPICAHCGRKVIAFENYCSTCKNVLVDLGTCRSAFNYEYPISKLIKDAKYNNCIYVIDYFAKALSNVYFQNYFNADYLVDCFLNAINVAQKRPDDDKEWYNILSVLIENKKLASLLDDNVFRDLKNKYNEYWSCRGRNNI